MEGQRQKFVRPEIKVLDAAKGKFHAVVSTEQVDRDGDIIRAAGWKLEEFQKHPVLLADHGHGDIRNQIGTWTAMEVRGNQLVGDFEIHIGQGNEKADWAANLAEKGQLAFSVGFIPNMDKAVPVAGSVFSFEFLEQELIEVSGVTVPSNPGALQALKGFGELHPVIAGVVDDVLEGQDWNLEIADHADDESGIVGVTLNGEPWAPLADLERVAERMEAAARSMEATLEKAERQARLTAWVAGWQEATRRTTT